MKSKRKAGKGSSKCGIADAAAAETELEKGKFMKELSSLAAVAAKELKEAKFVMSMSMKKVVKSSSKGGIADAVAWRRSCSARCGAHGAHEAGASEAPRPGLS